MRIGIDTLWFVPGKRGFGGGEAYLTNLIDHLARVDQDNEYLILVSPDNQDTFLEQSNFRKVVCPISCNSVSSRLAYEQLILPIWLRRHRIDVVHFPANTLSLLASVPTVLTIHDLVMQFYSRTWPQAVPFSNRVLNSWFVKLSARRATMVIVDSEFVRNELVQYTGIDSSRVRVVHLGLPAMPDPGRSVREIVRSYGVDGEYVLGVGTLSKHKNYEVLLRAFDLLKAKDGFESLQLVLIGRPGVAYDEFQRTLENLEHCSDVILPGFVPSEDLAAFYRNAIAFVQPSLYEGFGFPVLEAMACGTPVIAANAASLPELVKDVGLVFSPSSVEELFQHLGLLLLDQQRRDKLIMRGRQHVRMFTWQKAAQQTLDAYQQAYTKNR